MCILGDYILLPSNSKFCGLLSLEVLPNRTLLGHCKKITLLSLEVLLNRTLLGHCKKITLTTALRR